MWLLTCSLLWSVKGLSSAPLTPSRMIWGDHLVTPHPQSF